MKRETLGQMQQSRNAYVRQAANKAAAGGKLTGNETRRLERLGGASVRDLLAERNAMQSHTLVPTGREDGERSTARGSTLDQRIHEVKTEQQDLQDLSGLWDAIDAAQAAADAAQATADDAIADAAAAAADAADAAADAADALFQLSQFGTVVLTTCTGTETVLTP